MQICTSFPFSAKTQIFDCILNSLPLQIQKLFLEQKSPIFKLCSVASAQIYALFHFVGLFIIFLLIYVKEILFFILSISANNMEKKYIQATNSFYARISAFSCSGQRFGRNGLIKGDYYYYQIIIMNYKPNFFQVQIISYIPAPPPDTFRAQTNFIKPKEKRVFL